MKRAIVWIAVIAVVVLAAEFGARLYLRSNAEREARARAATTDIIVTMNKNGNICLGIKVIECGKNPDKKLASLTRAARHPRVYFYGDEDVRFESIVQAMANITKAGFRSVILVGRPDVLPSAQQSAQIHQPLIRFPTLPDLPVIPGDLKLKVGIVRLGPGLLNSAHLLFVDFDDSVSLDDVAMENNAQLLQKLSEIGERTPNLRLFVSASPQATYAMVIKAAADAQTSGIKSVAILLPAPMGVRSQPDMVKPPPPFVPPPGMVIHGTGSATGPTPNGPGYDIDEVQAILGAATGPTPNGPHDCYSDYPPISRSLNEQGTVLVQFTIGADGSISNVKVERSSGYPQLDNAAVSCVSEWSYHPAMQDGKPIAVSYEAKVLFQPALAK